MSRKEFKVIRIISDKEFIIDGGKNDEIESGQRFKIIDPKANPIKKDDEVIGYLGAQKQILIATDVRDNFSVLNTPYVKAKTKAHSMSATVTESFFNASIVPGHYERAKIDPAEMEPVENSNDPIHNGDSAILIS